MREGESPAILTLDEGCCGCGACAASCPKGCISMEADGLGFLRPSVDLSLCVGCGMCERACPELTPREGDTVDSAWWAYAYGDAVREASSSGGVFGLLASSVLDRGGAVYGAAFSEGCRSVRHVRVDSHEGLDAVMRSKYVQSAVGSEVYGAVEADLRAGLPVLFCGTACQVAGLRNCLSCRRVPEDGLLAVDVICHGTPSPRLWSEWVAHREESVGAPASAVNFRSKTAGWLSYSVRYEYRTEKGSAPSARVESGRFSDDWYMKAFLSNASLRGSCLSCPAKRSCGSDLTLGDFWGVQSCMPEVFEASGDKGVSAVLANTERGRKALLALDGLNIDRAEYVHILTGNPSLERSVEPYSRRDVFLDDVAAGVSLEELQRKWTFTPSLSERAARKARAVVRKCGRLVSRLLRRM